jgi:hypothetical protein
MVDFKAVKAGVLGIAGIAIILLILLLIFGNLSGNLGFATDSQGANDSASVIGNITSGVTGLASKFTTVFVLLGVLLILAVVFTIVKLFGLGGKKGNFME